MEGGPEGVAKQNAGYVVGYYDKKTADLWMSTLPDVNHPVFGRDIPFSDAESAYEQGKNAVKKE